jgi:tape measure domain-containing protein
MYVSITPNMSGFRSSVLRELKGVDGDAAAVGSSSGGAFSGAFSRAVSGIGSALATTLKVGAGAALAGISAAGAVGIKTAAQLETANIGFTTMLGSGEKAQAFLKDLTDFAAKTPFELPGLQQSASQLVATGIETSKVIPIMTTLGNITSGMGTGSEGIQRAVVAIQQMNAAQKISAEDLNQLRDAGVPVYELLAKATGKSTQEVAGLAQAGKLGKTELDALMQTLESGAGLERFNGLMEQQSKSLSGLASTAKDTFSIGMAGAIEPLIPLLKEGLGGAITWMGDTAFPAIKSGITETIGSVTAFVGAWKANDGDITSSGMPGFFERLGYFGHQAFDGIREVLAPLRPIFDSVVDTFKTLMPTLAPLVPQIFGLVTAFNPLSLIFKAIQPLLPTIITALGNLAATVGGALLQVLPIVTQVLGQLVGILAGSLAQILPTVVMLITSLSGIFAMLAPLVLHVVEAIAPLIVHLVQQFAPIIVSLVNSILPPLIVIFESIVSAIVPLVTILIDILVPIIQNVVVPIITIAFQIIAEVIKVAVAIILVIITGLVGFFRDVLGPVFVWLYENVVKPIWDGISAYIGAVITVVTAIISGIVWYFQNVLAPVFTWLYENIIKPVWEGIQKAISVVWDWLGLNVFQPMKNLFEVILPFAFNLLKAKAQEIWDGIMKILGDAWTWIQDHVFTPMSDFITKTIPKAFEDGVKAITKAWDDIAKLAKAPIDFVVTTILNNGILAAINSAMHFFGINDKDLKIPWPPSGWGSYEIGGYTGDGGKFQPKGVVHGGEFVLTKEQTANAGVGNLYALAKYLDGYVSGGLVSPLDSYVITQGFSGLLGHNGIDMAAPTGTPIHAAGPGTVSFAGWSIFGGGNETHIDHPNGLQTWYAHQNGFNIGQGQQVSQGQTIGTVGMTGLATGPHLHYMVLDGGWPFVLDPTPYLTGGGSPGSGGAFLNPLAGLLSGFLDQIKAQFPGAGIMIDVVTGAVKKVFDDGMSFIGGLFAGSTDKKGPSGRTAGIPYTLYDDGGWLPNRGGLQLIDHRAQKPDAVLTNERFRDFHLLAQEVERRGTAGGSVDVETLRAAWDGMAIELKGAGVMADHFAAVLRLERSRRL